jgi:hypothetical protein
MKRLSLHTFDVDPRRSRSRDTLLDENFRIDTNTRILPEPAPPGPNLGVVADGTGLKRVTGAVDAIEDEGLLSAEDVATIRRILAKYSGASTGTTGRAGITSSDAVAQARQAARDVAAGCARIASISKMNADFWEKRFEADERRRGYR